MGVTEAGEGEDARMKSAICTGTLLQDGLGDTSGFPSQNKSTRERDKYLQKTDNSFYGIVQHQIFSKRVMSLVVLEAPHMLVVSCTLLHRGALSLLVTWWP
ncbi:uncharacterized protein LOC113317843 [Papaver somniferum]|uniref:uncharacterized protein LOC113317843 n=1 Tax=Papaver somniferum TaxID=3469 RepID=UPI000E6FAD6C|nr:uncharacterized protein LOC113317843 [Papaver somniferum]